MTRNRSPLVAQSPADRVQRIPADIESIKLPVSGRRWYQDSMVVPLRLRVSARGCTWVFYGRTPAGPRRLALGRYPKMDLEQARMAAQRRAGEVAPAGMPVTFAQLRAAYLESSEFKLLAPRTQRSYAWVLGCGDYDGLSLRRLRDIRRQDILAIKDNIAADGRAFQNLLRPLQAAFTWGVDRGYLDVSPATRLKLPANEADPQPYNDGELGMMMSAADKVDEPWRTLYRVVAYTGQRPATWCDARWREVDLRAETLAVSRSRGRKSKLGRGWAIPLAPPVVALLKALRAAQGRNANEFVFGRALVVETRVRDRVAALAGRLDPANRGTLHRFRSTFLTWLSNSGVPTETQQRLAGHASPMEGSRAHYIPSPPSREMRDISTRYAEHVDYCVLL